MAESKPHVKALKLNKPLKSPKKTRVKINTQFHLAQRNYKRIIKRIRTSMDSVDSGVLEVDFAHGAESNQSLWERLESWWKSWRTRVSKGALNALMTILELPVRSAARTAFLEASMATLFALCAFLCVVAVLAICFFLFGKSIPTIWQIGVGDFLLGQQWAPTSEIFGIFPMIIGSLLVSVLAVVLGAGVGVLSAVYLACFANATMRRVLTPCVELLAGIPSIVYGFFGLIVIVSFIDFFTQTGGVGLLSASILLAIMILPTIILISKTSLESVPKSYYEGAIALGATHERAVFFIVLRAAKSGILASIVLGMGRAIGEAMAVIIVAGNQPIIPESITDGVRTLTTNIVMELGYAEGLHRDVLIACGVVLFAFILLLNLSFRAFSRRVSF